MINSKIEESGLEKAIRMIREDPKIDTSFDIENQGASICVADNKVRIALILDSNAIEIEHNDTILTNDIIKDEIEKYQKLKQIASSIRDIQYIDTSKEIEGSSKLDTASEYTNEIFKKPILFISKIVAHIINIINFKGFVTKQVLLNNLGNERLSISILERINVEIKKRIKLYETQKEINGSKVDELIKIMTDTSYVISNIIDSRFNGVIQNVKNHKDLGLID